MPLSPETRLTIDARRFREMAGVLGSLAKQNALIRAHQNIFFTVDARNHLFCRASDAQILVEIGMPILSVESKQEVVGATLSLPGADLAKIAGVLDTAGEVHLYGDGRIVQGRSRFTLPPSDEDGVAFCNGVSANDEIDVPCDDVARLRQGTAHAMAHHDVRTALNGTYIRWDGNEFRWTATDGYRLARMVWRHPAPRPGDSWDAILHHDSVQFLLQTVKRAGCTGASSLWSRDRKAGVLDVRLPDQDIRMQFNVLDAEYPDVERIIPQKSDRPISFTADRKDLEKGIREAILLCRDGTPTVQCARQSVIRDVSGTTADEGSASGNGLRLLSLFDGKSSQVDIDGVWKGVPNGGASWRMTVNGQFLLDAIATVRSEQIVLHFGVDKQPIVVWEDDGVQIVMPMRV